MKSWNELAEKYPMYRDEMTQDQERDFVNHCFDLYEQEGFAKVFWSQGGDYEEYHNKPFEVVNRLTEKECDLECLPMWEIKFKNGDTIHAYADEIIPREMIANGCNLDSVRQ